MQMDQAAEAGRIGSDITLCVATLDRPYCAQRFIRSVRARYPQIGIILVSQGEAHPELAATCAEHHVDLHTVAYDAGVTVARQVAIARARTKYLLFCDDDFIFGSDTDLGPAWLIVENAGAIDILGGLLVDLGKADPQSRTIRRWERYLFIDSDRRTLLSLPIDACAPAPGVVDGHCWFDADMVLNWKLVRRSLFDRFSGWDPRYHCNGEHEDFYLAVKARDDVRVAYAPSLVVYHHGPPNAEYRAKRQRQRGWSLLGEKWGLENYVEVPEPPSLRRFSRGQASVPVNELNHPALIADGTVVTEADAGLPGSGKLDSVVSEFRDNQLVDPGAVGLRLAAPGAVTARPADPLAIPVIVDAPFGFGCTGPQRPQLSYAAIKPGALAQAGQALGRTALMQDVRGSTLQYMNVTVPAATAPLARGVDISIRLWSQARGDWGRGVTMRIDYAPGDDPAPHTADADGGIAS